MAVGRSAWKVTGLTGNTKQQQQNWIPPILAVTPQALTGPSRSTHGRSKLQEPSPGFARPPQRQTKYTTPTSAVQLVPHSLIPEAAVAQHEHPRGSRTRLKKMHPLTNTSTHGTIGHCQTRLPSIVSSCVIFFFSAAAFPNNTRTQNPPATTQTHIQI